MDASPDQVAAFLGTGVAAFVSAWAALVRPLHKRVGEMQSTVAKSGEHQKEATKLRDRVAVLEQKLEALGDREGRSERKIELLEGQIPKFVTTEEFATYSSATTQSINALTEKVGRAIGALDALKR